GLCPRRDAARDTVHSAHTGGYVWSGAAEPLRGGRIRLRRSERFVRGFRAVGARAGDCRAASLLPLGTRIRGCVRRSRWLRSNAGESAYDQDRMERGCGDGRCTAAVCAARLLGAATGVAPFGGDGEVL